MIRRDEGEHELRLVVSDVDLTTAEPMGLKVGRFYERHPAYSQKGLSLVDSGNVIYAEEWEIAEHVERFTRGAHIVGAVPNFDTECLAAMLRRHRLAPAWHYHLIDIENLAIGYLWRKVAENVEAGYNDSIVPPLPWDSNEISRAVGVEPPGEGERHTAMGDARWAMRVYDKITGGAG